MIVEGNVVRYLLVYHKWLSYDGGVISGDTDTNARKYVKEGRNEKVRKKVKFFN